MNIPRSAPPADLVHGTVRNIIPAKKNKGNNAYIIDKNNIIPSKSDKIISMTVNEPVIALSNTDKPINGCIDNDEENPPSTGNSGPVCASNLKLTLKF